jgi:catechol 2,3-dioxygenase-like lactoylglutathione lyase family enzyme
VTGQPNSALDNGYDELIAIVADAKASADRLCRILGYTVVGSSSADAGLLALHELDPVSGWSEVLIAQPQCDRGRIRLWQSAGEIAPARRLGAQAWDVGGLFDVSLRSLGPIDNLLANFCRNGFSAMAPVADFNMGGLDVREALARDGDSLCFAMAERISPPLTGWEHVKGPASNPFNSVITVEDLDEAKRFFVEGLGWTALVDTTLVHEGGRNVMGLPLDIARDKQVALAIVQQQGRMDGSVELIAYPCEGHDFRGDQPHWRGLASLSFPVSDLDATLARAKVAGGRIVAPSAIDRGPYGSGRGGAVITPWNARLVFFETE